MGKQTLPSKIKKVILYMNDDNYIYSIYSLEKQWGIGYRAYHRYLKPFIETQSIPNSMGKPRKRLKLKDLSKQTIEFWEKNKQSKLLQQNLEIKKHSLLYYITYNERKKH